MDLLAKLHDAVYKKAKGMLKRRPHLVSNWRSWHLVPSSPAMGTAPAEAGAWFQSADVESVGFELRVTVLLCKYRHLLYAHFIMGSEAFKQTPVYVWRAEHRVMLWQEQPSCLNCLPDCSKAAVRLVSSRVDGESVQHARQLAEYLKDQVTVHGGRGGHMNSLDLVDVVARAQRR